MIENISPLIQPNQTDSNLLLILSTKRTLFHFIVLTTISSLLVLFVWLVIAYSSKINVFYSFLALILGSLGVIVLYLLDNEFSLGFNGLWLGFILLEAIVALLLPIRLTFLILATIFAFLAFGSLLRLMAKKSIFIDLTTKQLVIQSHPFIFKDLEERCLEQESLKAASLAYNSANYILVLELVSNETIQFFASQNKLILAILYLMKYLKLPITLKAYTFSENTEDKTFTPEVLQYQEDFTPNWQRNHLLDQELRKLGWEKGDDERCTLREVRKITLSGILAKFLMGALLGTVVAILMIPVIFSVSWLTILLISFILNAPSYLDAPNFTWLFDINVFISVLWMLWILFMLFFFLMPIKRREIVINEEGLKIGNKFWPYGFIQTIKINEEMDTSFQVIADFFLLTEVIESFNSKKDAEIFHQYITFCLTTFKTKSLSLNLS